MTRDEYLVQHQRQAAQFRSAAETATTMAAKTMLLRKAEEQDRIVQELLDPEQQTDSLEAV